ncbi:hypothetical protein SELMODRAFT_184479 [Selaginella moellendorffii]|uniref:Exocyst subunit Exo70 family protein n=1 Tax=Selaginella moellendorffii TaxID=88036 RepID=D8T120_SELML|nr:exocyst complex component EXO70A1 [Selaginella moellendorffii]EFJ09561.1 hypothetical protein SELMODRAFT_184479 [Selaginella moellendorffii]|eukprot:XP_002989287.1 exocyst complex component EXO70A1 [Selaginella moellendorffii]
MAMDGDALAATALLLRDSLHRSQSVTQSVMSILGSFDARLSGLESAMRPTQLRTHSYRTVHHNIDKTLKAAQAILTRFDVSRQVETKILKGPREDLGGYVAAVDEIKRNIEFFTYNRSFKNDDAALTHARTLLSKAMEKLNGELKLVLSQHGKPVEPARLLESLPKTAPAHHDNSTPDAPATTNDAVVLPMLLPPRIVPQLHDIAERMIGSGHHQQCLKTYRDARASVLEQSLRKLGVEKLTREDVQKLQWEVLEGKIGNWIQHMRAAVKLLFAAEWKLCNQVFDGLDPYREACFAEITQNSFSVLSSTGEAIARSKKSPEKLFVLLDMFETMHDLLPEMKTMFAGETSASVRDAAAGLTQKLAQTARDTFDDFLDAVEKDATKTAVQDGTVHPLTSYVINYVKFLFDYQITLRQLFDEEDKDVSSSRLAAATSKIMVVLQNNLDSKAKQYKDPALTHIFLMNNIHYMVKSVRRSEAKDLLGDDWIQRHRRIVQQHAQAYQRTAWGKLLQYLSGQGLSSSSGGSGMSTGGAPDGTSSGISRAVLKERFKNFNILFEELHQRQSQWTIPDAELRDAVRLAVAEVLLPAYRSFIKRYSAILENGKNTQRYIKYTADDLDRLLGELFEGKTRGGPGSGGGSSGGERR